jgi:hypothetical protein
MTRFLKPGDGNPRGFLGHPHDGTLNARLDMTTTEPVDQSKRIARYSIAVLAAPLAYVLSSGPVLATAFWLRDATQWDGFYRVMWLYYPLLACGPLSYPVAVYLSWWCRLFGTAPPG